MFKFGWFSSGRDQAAIDLFVTAHDHMQSGFIKGQISFVFCDREFGENQFSDRFIAAVREREIPLIMNSSRDLRKLIIQKKPEIEEQRKHFDAQVIELLKDFDVEVIVLAGYMLIVSPLLCNSYLCLNLHPAVPGGPKGTWQEVIWQLIAVGAREAGAMMHLATPELDAGPPVSYIPFPINSNGYKTLWANLNQKRKNLSLGMIKISEGESEPLFVKIRAEELKREFPLILLTLKSLSEGCFTLTHKGVEIKGKLQNDGFNLTKRVEKYLKEHYPMPVEGESVSQVKQNVTFQKPRRNITPFEQGELPLVC